MTKVVGQYYNSVTFYTPKDMTGSTAAVTEWVTPSATAFTYTPTVVTPEQYMSRTTLTDLALNDSPVELIGNAAFELGADMGRQLDIACQAKLDDGTQVIYSAEGDASDARNQVDATDIMSHDLLAEAATRLNANDATKYEGGSYIAIMHPYVFHDYITTAGTGSLVSPIEYRTTLTEAEQFLTAGAMEQGMTRSGVRIFTSSNVQFFADASNGAGSTGTIDVYPTYVFGKDSFAHGMIGSVQTIYKPLGSGDDPGEQRADIVVKVRSWFEILRQTGIYRIESASTLGANS